MPQYTHQSNYGYVPSEACALSFIVLFGLSAAIHSVQAYRSKYWIIYPTLVLGALIEVMGYAARLWSNRDVLLLTPFLMQICVLTLAPVFFSAYCYAVLGSAIHRLGQEYSLLRANWYFIAFITADLISLILQAVGGGQASAAAATSAPSTSATNIMVAGIIFQLVTMGVFIALGIDFCLRARTGRGYAFQIRRLAREAAVREAEKPQAQAGTAVGITTTRSSESGETRVDDVESGKAEGLVSAGMGQRKELGRWWIMMLGVGLASTTIFIRGIFRSIELVHGWGGYLMAHEIYMNVLDGLMMLICVLVFNFINPLFVLPKKEKWGTYY